MAIGIETAISVAKQFADEARQAMPIGKAIWHGSYDAGLTRKDSDVDVCFFSQLLAQKTWTVLLSKCIY